MSKPEHSTDDPSHLSQAITRPVRVRFAPSPTGYLHIGGARSALYNYLYAKHTGGEFIFRVEDTDQARSTEESMRMQIQDLFWLHLAWDQGPDPKTLQDVGPKGPYRQSRRLPIYHEYAKKLLDSRHAYHCFCSDEVLEEKKRQAQAAGLPPHYDGTCRGISRSAAEARLKNGERAVVRFRAIQHDYTFHDLIRGDIHFPAGMVGDFVIVRSDGMPVYNFCCVVDDGLMEITHVLRGEEHLSNTLRQLMIYEALGIRVPLFGHMSIILGADKQKMSKRHGATSCNEYRLAGYLPEAIVNFIALLGWSSPKGEEILSLNDLIEQFSLDRLHAAPAVFDDQKLKWVNAQHLRSLETADLWQRLEPFLLQAGFDDLPADFGWRARALEVFKTSMETLVDGVELFRPISNKSFELTDEGRETLGWPSSLAVIQTWRDKLTKRNDAYLTGEDFAFLQNEIKTETSAKGKDLFMPIRVAVIGKPHGAELKILVPLLNRESLIIRAERCLEFIHRTNT